MFGDNLDRIVKSIEKNYEADEIFFTKPGRRFPSRLAVKSVIKDLRRVLFPGYFGDEMLTPFTSPEYFIGETLIQIERVLREQIVLAMTYTSDDRDAAEVDPARYLCGGTTPEHICERASEVCTVFFDELPSIQRVLLTDVQALYDGDPAAGSKEEVIFSYPGLYAIYVYRIAHVLYEQNVPIIPRIMTELAHSARASTSAPAPDRRVLLHRPRHGRGHRRDHRHRRPCEAVPGVTLGALSTRGGSGLPG